MAFTKIAAAGIGSTETVTLHSLEVLNNATVGGVLTYEDVTNVDSVGLITARNGIVVGSGITLSKDGDGFFTGVVTATSYAGDGSGLTGIAATDNVRTGILDVAGVGTFRNDVNIPDKIIHLGDTDTAIRFPAADTFTVETAGGERFRVTSDGKLQVPIGSDIEIGQLASSNHANGNAGSVLLGIKDGGGGMCGVKVTNVDAGTYNDQIITFLTAQGGISGTTERLRITSNGSVGIGTDTPTATSKLDVIDGIINVGAAVTTNDTRIQFTRKSTGSSGWIGIPNWHSDALYIYGPTSSSNEIAARYTSGAWSFFTGGDASTQRLTITSAGKVGINIDDPDAKLEVRDSGATGIIIRCTNTQSTDVNKAIRVRNNSDTDTFAVSHTGKVFPLDNIVMANGKGIDFSATGDATGKTSELLDDYEEGTWTPTASNFTIANNYSSIYTRIGNVVNVQCYITAAAGSGVAAISIGGLPFTSKGSLVYTYAAGRIGGTNGASDIVFQFNQNSTNVTPFVYDGNINEGMVSGQHLIFSGFYYAA